MEVGMHTRRSYRCWSVGGGLTRFRIIRFESDIEIAAESDLTMEACRALGSVRRPIEDYGSSNAEFLNSLEPLDPQAASPGIVRRMCMVSREWGVGPMASVAGAVAQYVGRSLEVHSRTVIVENGGDIWIRSHEPVRCMLFAGTASPFSRRICFSVNAWSGAGVCTSSHTVGHSRSFGRADAVTVVAEDCIQADAAATSIANRIHGPDDLERELERAAMRKGIRGLVACCGGKLAAFGVDLLDLGKEGMA
jgi:ApbE superfamily uncharacterized protein (UPF0280 family)